jgi:hypothetical protein
MSRLLLTPFALIVAAMLASSASAASRVALVVGVSKYEHAPMLANPTNDAADMAAALRRLGFDVELLLNPSRGSLEAAVRRYGDRSTGADVSLFHYSGHALEAAGRNWVLPSTVDINRARDLEFEAIDLNTILEQTDGGAKLSIAFLDACRDNPFARRLTGGSRDIPLRGLGPVDISATGTLVAFATAPGQVALDGDTRNSPFTAALLKHIETPGLEVKSLMVRVTRDVLETTSGKQRPWQNSSLEGEFYFIPPQLVARPSDQTANNLEVVFWDSVKASRNPADFEAYLTRFPKGNFVELARNRIAMLRQEASKLTSSNPGPEPVRPAPPSSPSSLADRLTTRFATLSIAPDEADARTQRYLALPSHRAIAAAPRARHTWRTGGWPSTGAAETAALEACQVYYGEPCTLVASDDGLVQSDGLPVLRDMARTRYAERFEPERIPAVNAAPLHRTEVASYRTALGPKAVAYHPWGKLFVVADAGSQFEAEEQALAQCNTDPTRKGADGPCFLYSVGDQVVLPQRLVKPRPRPQTIPEAFAYLSVTRDSYAYFSQKTHKAIALAIESGQTFRWNNDGSAAGAEQKVLEACQLAYRTQCVLLASDDELQAPDPWKAPRRDMARVGYVGEYKPENVPLFSVTDKAELRSYVSMREPKAMVLRPAGARIAIATGATSEEAQSKALAACNVDLAPMPCLVYAVNDRVILNQRRTEPLK